MKRAGWVVVGALMLASQPAWAARTQVHVAAESQDYGQKFGGMIGRGALNVLTSFMDILVNTVNETKAGPPLVGTLTGVAKGTGCGILRLGSGAVDLVTFWVPGFNGFPVSDSYDNCFAGMTTSAAMEAAPAAAEEAQAIITPEIPAREPGEAQAATIIEPAEPTHPKRTWKK